ncbi:hypothetical protein SDC9_143631 [bioreactor metagenome]|uniref:Uncharacterized protein n=1 Tax=bioreactor metagenome TaxID=1076179 RepID=A0A645E500_9ZZZZ
MVCVVVVDLGTVVVALVLETPSGAGERGEPGFDGRAGDAKLIRRGCGGKGVYYIVVAGNTECDVCVNLIVG